MKIILENEEKKRKELFFSIKSKTFQPTSYIFFSLAFEIEHKE